MVQSYAAIIPQCKQSLQLLLVCECHVVVVPAAFVSAFALQCHRSWLCMDLFMPIAAVMQSWILHVHIARFSVWERPS